MADRDQIALDAAKWIMELVYGQMPPGGSAQLMAQVQVVVAEAMATERAEIAVAVTDEMVERGVVAYKAYNGRYADGIVRDVLTAALRTKRDAKP